MTIQKNISLLPYNTFKINAVAKFFSIFSKADDLTEFSFPKPAPAQGNPEPLLVLGGGSNLLLTRDFDGWVLKNEIRGIEQIAEDEDYVYVKVGAGENWHQFVLYCLERNWAGVENLSLIPGNVGASPMQNIGAYGVEIREVFQELEAWHIEENRVYSFSLNDCEFGYRESIFKRRYRGQFIILNVVFRLTKKPVFNTRYGAIREELDRMGIRDLSIRSISQAIINIRRSKLPDPAVIGNAGSFFKNPEIPADQFVRLREDFPGIVGFPSADRAETPSGSSSISSSSSGNSSSDNSVSGGKVKLAAGWMIEQCGWKGFRKGDAGCHAAQALVLVNYGQATGKEIYDLSTEILESVREKFGVQLEREVNIV